MTNTQTAVPTRLPLTRSEIVRKLHTFISTVWSSNVDWTQVGNQLEALAVECKRRSRHG